MSKTPKPVKAVTIARKCSSCFHWSAPTQEDMKVASKWIEIAGSHPNPNVCASFTAYAASKLDGCCSFDPTWIKTGPDHYCGQWELKK